MNREVHVRICERLGVQIPGATRQPRIQAKEAPTGHRASARPYRHPDALSSFVGGVQSGTPAQVGRFGARSIFTLSRLQRPLSLGNGGRKEKRHSITRILKWHFTGDCRSQGFPRPGELWG